ncbi:MAG: B12-binding domain-containing radical SAM protein, partial [Promethearchaeota archaeon]
MVNPPIGLGYLASFMEEHSYKVYILDLALRNITFDSIVKFLEKKKPILIGITTLTSYYVSMKNLSNNIKKERPNIPIVLGGFHVSSLPLHSLKDCKADFVVLGEGEDTFLDLTRVIESGASDFSSIKVIAFLDENDQLVISESRPLIKSLDLLPMIA